MASFFESNELVWKQLWWISRSWKHFKPIYSISERRALWRSIHWIHGGRHASNYQVRWHFHVSRKHKITERKTAIALRVQPHGLYCGAGRWSCDRRQETNSRNSAAEYPWKMSNFHWIQEGRGRGYWVYGALRQMMLRPVLSYLFSNCKPMTLCSKGNATFWVILN